MAKNRVTGKKAWMVALLLSGIAAALAFGAYRGGLWRLNYPKEYLVQGLDVSHHQGVILWDRVPEGLIRFVYIKATEGGDWKDSRFEENWNGSRGHGFKTGAYHFFTLCRSGAEQATNFINVVPAERDALPPAIDLEYVGNCSRRPDKPDLLKELSAYILALKMHYDREPVLYVTYDFYRDYIAGSAFEALPIWIRDVWGRPDLKSFPSLVLWQFADNARIEGIAGPVDMNAAVDADFIPEFR